MGVVTSLLARAAVSQRRPFFSGENCLNRRQTKHPCRVCTEVCPAGAISENPARQGVNWEECINCGLCVTGCPSRCFLPDLKTRKSLSDAVKSSVVAVSCIQGETGPGVRMVECLCGIPWEWIAALALRVKVILYVGECGLCEENREERQTTEGLDDPEERTGRFQRRSRRKQIEETLEQVENFLGSRLYRERVEVTEDPQRFGREIPEGEMDRREFFNMVRHGLKRSAVYGVNNILPEEEVGQNGFMYRRLLAETVGRRYKETVDCRYEETVGRGYKETLGSGEKGGMEIPRYGILLPAHNGNCFACGICEKICPHQAISVSEEKEGKRTIFITPERCTGCGLCGNLCPYNGINGMALTMVRHMGKQPLVAVRSASCGQCGAVIRPGTKENLCASCLVKNKKRRR